MTDDDDLGYQQQEEIKTQTEAAGKPPLPPKKTSLGYGGSGNHAKGTHKYFMSILFSKGEQGMKAAEELADLIERKLAKKEQWTDEALEVAKRFNIPSDEVDAYCQLITKGEENRRAARLADLIERRLDGEPWTEDDQSILLRFNITREQVDTEVMRRGGKSSEGK